MRGVSAILIGAALMLSACSEDTSSPNETVAVETTVQQTDTTFVSPQPPDEFASGLTIGFIPEGFSWVWNEGHETATFHMFQTQDESEQLSVGIQMSPPPHPGSGEVQTRGDREFTIYNEGDEVRITEDVGNEVRVDVVSSSLDADTLMRIAESVTYNPDAGS